MQKTTMVVRKRVFNGVNIPEVVRSLIRENKLPHITLCLEGEVSEPKNLATRAQAQEEARDLQELGTAATMSMGISFEHKGGSKSAPWIILAYISLNLKGNFITGSITREFHFKPAIMPEEEDFRSMFFKVLTDDFFGRTCT